MSFSDYLENELLDHVFGKGAYTPPTIYLALSTANPLDTGAGMAEPSGGSYARKVTAAASWTTASGGAMSNALALAFPTATASWGTVTHFAAFDAASGGNMLFHGALGTPKAIGIGDTASFAIGDIDGTLT